MRTLCLRITLILAVVIVVLPGRALAQGRTVTVQVPANQAWTPTGVVLRSGQGVQIKASGTVQASSPSDTRSFYHDVPPEGRWERHAGKPAPLLPALALLGRVGDGPVLFVGSGAQFSAGSPYGTGQLYLGINDDILGDNSGAWTVRITVEGSDEGGGQATGTAITWGTTATELRGQNGRNFSYRCPGGGQPGRLWGTDLYTDDSSICTAAVHAGLIDFVTGGPVTIEIRPGAQSYFGSARNGVSSGNYGGWTGSYVFTSRPNLKPGGFTGTPIDWSTSATQLRGQNGQRVTYYCPGNGTPGRVWGSDVYTDDSSICTAAVHAGLLSQAGGGTVTIEIRPGQQSYAGSIRNGVSSTNYGAWSGSYVFVPSIRR